MKKIIYSIILCLITTSSFCQEVDSLEQMGIQFFENYKKEVNTKLIKNIVYLKDEKNEKEFIKRYH